MTSTASSVKSAVRQASVPWAAWYGDGRHTLSFPAGWTIDNLSPPAGLDITDHEFTDDQIAAALDAPYDSPPIEALAAGKNSAVIVVDDLARPTPTARLLPPVLARLSSAGVPLENVALLIATGAHGPVPSGKLAEKLGAAALARCRVECHDPRGTLVETDLEYGDRRLRVNATFAAAELKIALGSVMPHPFAGYSGGAKMVLPGLTDIEATQRAHKFVQLGLRGGYDPERNRFRLEAESVARKLGLNFVVCAVTGAARQLTSLHAGDVVAAHRRATAAAQAAGRTPCTGVYDALVLNAYPKDVNLVQSAAALVSLRRLGKLPIAEHGVVILSTAASEGVGRHDLFGPQGVSARVPAPLRALAGRPLWVYAPRLTAADVHQLFAAEYPRFVSAEALCESLEQRLGPVGRVGIVPAAAMQELVQDETTHC